MRETGAHSLERVTLSLDLGNITVFRRFRELPLQPSIRNLAKGMHIIKISEAGSHE